MRLMLIDHYDSFTFNVIDWLERSPDVAVTRIAYDDDHGMAAFLRAPGPLVLSPGPKRPQDAPQTLRVLQKVLGKVPILGICLGHQMLAQVAGAGIVPAAAPFHGKALRILPDPTSALFRGFGASGFQAATYNSLVAQSASLGSPWRVVARSEAGEIQALERAPAGEAPAFGVQFHPESFLSENADLLRDNWLGLARNA